MAADDKKEDTLQDVSIGKNERGYFVPVKRLEPLARIILMGVYDDENILSTLRGMKHIVCKIWQYALQFNKHYFLQFGKPSNFESISRLVQN